MTSVQIVEVGPRDGFQNIGPFIPTETKIAMIRGLAAAGVRRMEITSFVSPRAIPQLADAAEVLANVLAQGAVLPQVLVPNARYGHKAIEAGARFLSYVISVSESHSRSNVRVGPNEALADYARLVAEAPAGIRMRLNLATAFHCPFEGMTPATAVLDLLGRALEVRPNAEGCLCDPTGRGTGGSQLPDLAAEFSREPHVRGVCSMARTMDPDSANSQFFIMFDEGRFLDGQYTVVGSVVSGMEYVDNITRGSQAQNGAVADPDRMTNRIHRDDAAAAVVHLLTMSSEGDGLYLLTDDAPAPAREVATFLARELGVTRQTVYRYFPSADGLATAAALDTVAELTGHLGDDPLHVRGVPAGRGDPGDERAGQLFDAVGLLRRRVVGEPESVP